MLEKRTLQEQVERISKQLFELADDVEMTGFSPESHEAANAILWPNEGVERLIDTFFRVHDEGKNPKLVKLLRAAVVRVGRLSGKVCIEARDKIQPEVVAERLRRVARALSGGKTAKGPPMLSRRESALLDILLAMPPERGLTRTELLSQLVKKQMGMDETTFKRHAVPKLRAYGLEHQKGIGYRIQPDRRPETPQKNVP